MEQNYEQLVYEKNRLAAFFMPKSNLVNSQELF